MVPELRAVLRRLRQSPRLTLLSILTLAIGMGATTAIFSVVHGVLIKPLPYPDSDRLVGVWQKAPGLNMDEVSASPSTYFTYREESRTFQDIALWQRDSDSVTGLGETAQVRSLIVTAGALPILGVQPYRGRWFSERDDRPKQPMTVMLSYAYWQRRFGGSDSAIGKNLTINGRSCQIIGVMPEGFQFLDYRPEIVLPFQFNRGEAVIGNFSYNALARLKPGVTITEADADVARMLPILIRKFPPAPGLSLAMIEQARLGPDVRPLKNDVIGDIGRSLWVILATVGIVLVIAAANVANLMLVRTQARQQEIAVRSALGASRGRIVGEMLFESLVLGVAGGIAGTGVAYAALNFLKYLDPGNLPRLEEVSIDGAALFFTLGIALLSGLLFGLVPAIRYSGTRVADALRSGGRTMSDGRERHLTRGILVVAQVALALLLLTGCGLMMRTLYAISRVNPGFLDAQSVFTLRIFIPEQQVPDKRRVLQMHRDIAVKLAAIPGVQSVGMTNSVTMDGNFNMDPVFVEDRAGSESQLPPIRRFKHIAPGYFQTMGNPILAGRDLTWTDVEQLRPVALVSRALAREYWPTPEAAIGRRIRESPKGIWREIIGVVADEYDNGVDRGPTTIAYWPILKENFWNPGLSINRSLAFAIRTPRAGNLDFLGDVQKAVWSVNPELPLASTRTLAEIQRSSTARKFFTLVMLSLAAGMALILGLIGIYGVIAYSVSQRTREIGIRMALGATQQSVTSLFVGYGIRLVAIGVALGIVAAIPTGRLIETLLYGVNPQDPLTYAVVSGVLILTAFAAAYFPARRAAKVEPLVALREE